MHLRIYAFTHLRTYAIVPMRICAREELWNVRTGHSGLGVIAGIG